MMKWLLPLLFFLLPAPSNAVTPVWTNRCGSPRINAVGNTTVSCSMYNTVAGRMIFMTGVGAANTITVSGTESPTACVTGTAGLAGQQVVHCYLLAAASNHGTFTITVTSSGGQNRAFGAYAREYPGTWTFDTSCNAGATSCSLTTAQAGEWLDVAGVDLTQDLSPAGSFLPQQYGNVVDDITIQSQKAATWYQIAGGAGSKTMQYTSTGGFPNPAIVGLAFQVTNAVSPPNVYALQECYFAYPDTGRTQVDCPLHNYTANNIVVYGFGTMNDTSILSCDGTNCGCPANSQIFHVYSGVNLGSGLCFAFNSSNQSVFAPGILMHTGSGQTVIFIQSAEYVNLTSLDTGSEANAAALTVNYTTAANNEVNFTTCMDANTADLSPGGSALQLSSGTNANSTTASPQIFTMTTQVIASAGSGKTTSCSGAGTVPEITTFSYGQTATSTLSPRHSQIF